MLITGMTLPRTASVRLNRLRTGVGGFRSCMYKWVMASSPACECGAEEQTVDHVVLQCPIHGRRKDIVQGGGSRGFSQNFFQGGSKSGEIRFIPLEIEKKLFLLIISKSRGDQASPCPPFRRPWSNPPTSSWTARPDVPGR